MKKINTKSFTNKSLFVGLVSSLYITICSQNIYALPLSTNMNTALSEAAKAENRELQQKAYQKDSNIKGIEQYCSRLAKFRLGNNYLIKITDRKVPLTSKSELKYTVVGNAENPKDNAVEQENKPTLSFMCKVSIVDNKYILDEFKLFSIVESSQNPQQK